MNFKFLNKDSLIEMQNMPDESVDCILTDPPYKYLKGQKLERDFDENMFFRQSKRILKNTGLIVLFGRGTSFYRWNMILSELGFTFKEEIIWDKSYTSSPVMALSRVHENIVIYSKKDASINISFIPYTESKDENYQSILQDIKRIKSALNNTSSMNDLLKYVEDKTIDFNQGKTQKYKATLQSIRIEQDRAVKTMQAIDRGMREKSIMRVKREHYKAIHPTQKPVRLLERLLSIASKKGDLVFDPFAGSCSTGIACRNTGRKFIGFEIDEEYYQKALDRINGKNLNGFEKTDVGGQKINYGQTELNFD